MGKKSLTRLRFRIDLYFKLLGYAEKAKLQSLRMGLGAKRVFNPENERLQHWEKRSKRGTCAWCEFDLKCKRVLGKDAKGVPELLHGENGFAVEPPPLFPRPGLNRGRHMASCWEEGHPNYCLISPMRINFHGSLEEGYESELWLEVWVTKREEGFWMGVWLRGSNPGLLAAERTAPTRLTRRKFSSAFHVPFYVYTKGIGSYFLYLLDSHWLGS